MLIFVSISIYIIGVFSTMFVLMLVDKLTKNNTIKMPSDLYVTVFLWPIILPIALGEGLYRGAFYLCDNITTKIYNLVSVFISAMEAINTPVKKTKVSMRGDN